MNTNKFNIYFKDLNSKAKAELTKCLGFTISDIEQMSEDEIKIIGLSSDSPIATVNILETKNLKPTRRV